MSLLHAIKQNYGGFGNLTANTATIDSVDVEEARVTGNLTVEGNATVVGNVLADNVVCDTLNYTTLNPPVPAYTTVSTLSTLVTQTILDGALVWCADKAVLFRGLRNPQDTTILPSGTPWGANGFLQVTYEMSQNATNAPTIVTLANQLFVGTTVNVSPTSLLRVGPGAYELRWSPQLPYAGYISSVVLSESLPLEVATVGVTYSRTGPPWSLVSVKSRDYAGNPVDFSSTSPRTITFTINFVPRT
jgi:hypothetical protein